MRYLGVFTFDVKGVPLEDIDHVIEKIKSMIDPETFGFRTIIIPRRDEEAINEFKLYKLEDQDGDIQTIEDCELAHVELTMRKMLGLEKVE